jgi:hypothetical protein
LTDFERVLATGIATSEETASISKIISALQARAEAARDVLPPPEVQTPQQETETASRAESNERLGGGTDVRVGQLYDAGDYQKAVDAITRGLKKEQLSTLTRPTCISD